MRDIIFLIFFAIGMLTVTAQSYYSPGNYNRLGLQAKLSVLDIDTQNFNLEGETGFLGGLTTRGRLYNDFGIVYGIDFLSANINLQSRPLGESRLEETRYTVIGAQLNLLFSYNLIEKHLAIDFGPALLVNGKMNLRQTGQRDNIVEGYTALRAEDIEEISRINGFGIIGITAGFEHVRFIIQYQYGFTNMFNNLNDRDLLDVDPNANNFKGSPSLLAGGIVLYL
nr:conserved hypothetical protein [uncultured bacterium]